MYKKILISSGVTILILLMGVWIYLLLVGTPEEITNRFADFTNQPNTEVTPIARGPVQLSETIGSISQLSNRPVAGFVVVEKDLKDTSTTTATSTPPEKLLYVEKGTGHVYELDLSSGIEDRVSGTTFNKTVLAVFNEDGSIVILNQENGDSILSTMQIFGANSNKELKLPLNSKDFYFTEDDKLKFTLTNNNETIGYEIDIETEISTELWKVPFTDIDTFWHEDTTIVVNQPTGRLKGGIYEIINGQLHLLVKPEYALTAVTNQFGNKILYSYFDVESKNFVTKHYDIETQTNTSQVSTPITTKCVFAENIDSTYWCALDVSYIDLSDRDLITSWYRGEFSFNDSLWKNDSLKKESEFYINLSSETGSNLDVDLISISRDGKNIYLKNKINNTLWLYRI